MLSVGPIVTAQRAVFRLSEVNADVSTRTSAFIVFWITHFITTLLYEQAINKFYSDDLYRALV